MGSAGRPVSVSVLPVGASSVLGASLRTSGGLADPPGFQHHCIMTISRVRWIRAAQSAGGQLADVLLTQDRDAVWRG
jgi:hypothetical protein